jgi:DMSO/TMAO reductase YedYZ molybdopterin-dependent catalytic subunit
MLGGAVPAPILTVVGAAKPLALTAADLAAMPRGAAVLSVHGATQRCEGVWLRDVLARAAVPAGEAVRGPALTMAVLAEAQDGYGVLFSLGEIDAALGNGRLLVADRCDGKPLAEADGPLRIVAEGEKRGARSVRGLVRLVVMPVNSGK